MILGLISFSIFIGEEIFSIKNKDYFLELELTHIIIFFVALFYIMKAAWLLKILDDSRKVWDRACNMSYRSLRVVSQIFVVCFSMLWCLCTSCASCHTLHTYSHIHAHGQAYDNVLEEKQACGCTLSALCVPVSFG